MIVDGTLWNREERSDILTNDAYMCLSLWLRLGGLIFSVGEGPGSTTGVMNVSRKSWGSMGPMKWPDMSEQCCCCRMSAVASSYAYPFCAAADALTGVPPQVSDHGHGWWRERDGDIPGMFSSLIIMDC